MADKFVNERYNRQFMMPEWGEERQHPLSKARVAVIGSGGVKSTLLMALAAAGIGSIRIIEFDTVELSNLNRQTLFRTSDIGRPKGLKARDLLTDINPTINVEWINECVDENNIDRLLDGWDYIVEGGESPHVRNVVNEYCLRTGKPMTHASAQFSYGYVFSMLPAKKTACFACLFPKDHTRAKHTGPVPVWVVPVQIAGSLGAAEVIKYYLGYVEEMHTNRQLAFSSILLSGKFENVQVKRNPSCPICSKAYS